MVEVDTVEDLVEFAKIERSGGTVPQLTKTGRADPPECASRYQANAGSHTTLLYIYKLDAQIELI